MAPPVKQLEYFFPGGESEHLSFSTEDLTNFCAINAKRSRRVAVITSGGTAVPLERNAVRFLDNFSTGSRGSACAEELLAARSDYAVIFLARDSSKMPYTHMLAEAIGGGARSLRVDRQTDGAGGVFVALPGEKYVKAMRELRRVQEDNRLLVVEYKTVQEYLYSLRRCAGELANQVLPSMFVLAAAVSDFYIPESAMSSHKIQSSSAGLTIQMDAVPKCLGLLVDKWAPKDALVVSFKVSRISLSCRCHS